MSTPRSTDTQSYLLANCQLFGLPYLLYLPCTYLCSNGMANQDREQTFDKAKDLLIGAVETVIQVASQIRAHEGSSASSAPAATEQQRSQSARCSLTSIPSTGTGAQASASVSNLASVSRTVRQAKMYVRPPQCDIISSEDIKPTARQLQQQVCQKLIVSV